MLQRFLKRFEKLEGTHQLDSTNEILRVSKRFERLEIGDKKLEIAITDRILQEEKAPASINYFIFCPYCGKENNPENENCDNCKRSLKTRLTQAYQEKVLKRCICGAVSQQSRRNCWVCGRDFSLWGDNGTLKDSENVITLNIDGKIYKSTDKELPPGIIVLMERIRKEGYKKELIDEWIGESNREVEDKQEALESRLTNIKFQISLQTIGLVVLIIFSIFWLRSCRITY